MGESRQELLQWLNNTFRFQPEVTKVETCGTGAVLCQVYDSIFLDVPMHRVKFNVNAEYQFRENFKILTNTFRKHSIDRPIEVEQLVKCKMQDNLEFLQWSKRYWDQHFPGHEYDAVGRRNGAGGGGGGAPMPVSRAPVGRSSAAAAPNTAAARRTAGGAAAAAPPRAGSRQAGGNTSGMLQARNAELMETVTGLERERDFYFSKLRDIELLVQQAAEADPSRHASKDEAQLEQQQLLAKIQEILYSTEEGFEIPPENDEGFEPAEEETF